MAMSCQWLHDQVAVLKWYEFCAELVIANVVGGCEDDMEEL